MDIVLNHLISETWLWPERSRFEIKSYAFLRVLVQKVKYFPNVIYICVQALAERLAENSHDLWAKTKKQELEEIGEECCEDLCFHKHIYIIHIYFHVPILQGNVTFIPRNV